MSRAAHRNSQGGPAGTGVAHLCFPVYRGSAAAEFRNSKNYRRPAGFHQSVEGTHMNAVKSLFLASAVAICASAQIPNFQHVVVIVQENRTPDNLFQSLCNSPSAAVTTCSNHPKLRLNTNIQISNWLNKNSSTARPSRLRFRSRTSTI